MIEIKGIVAAFVSAALASGVPAAAQIATGAPTAQVPSGVAPVASNYQIGAGDLLSVTVYRAPDLAGTLRVTDDGTINFPSIGQIKVSDLTAAQVADKLAAGLKARGILIAPNVNVLVAEVRSKLVLVMGAVQRPGEVPLDQPGATLAAVLARAGATFGTGSGIVTVMGGRDPGAPREQFRIADLVSGTSDRPARAGEILVVQSAPTIYVSGEVGRAGSYPLEPNMTVGQAIALGGGVTPRGSQSRLRVTRKGPDGKAYSLKKVDINTPVQADDLILVRQRLF